MLDTAEKKGLNTERETQRNETSENISAGGDEGYFVCLHEWMQHMQPARFRHLHAGEGSNLKGMGNFIRFSTSIYLTHPHPFM